LAGLGLLLFTQAPVEGSFLLHVFPSMLLLGLGAGMAFNPVFLAAMNDVKPEDSGLASGLVNTSFMMGGALGLAILASIAASQTLGAVQQGVEMKEALNTGYHAAFFIGAMCAILAGFVGYKFLKIKPTLDSQATHKKWCRISLLWKLN
jgi:MFS family permease